MLARSRQQRTAVARAWGTVTAATAMPVPSRAARSGVRRLPIPNPTTPAVAPEKIATTRRTRLKRLIHRPGLATAVEGPDYPRRARTFPPTPMPNRRAAEPSRTAISTCPPEPR